MTNINNYSKIKIDSRGVRGVVSGALKRLRYGGIFHKKGKYGIRVVFVTPAESRKLNKKYRKKNKATNVLSFDYGTEGELVLCPAVIKKEAKKAGNTVKFQTAWMIVHGLLHLSDVHHEKSEVQQRKVERLEEEILSSLL